MKRKLRKAAVVAKKAGRFAVTKAKNRDFKNFYGGKSLSHLVKKTATVAVTEGPLGLYRRSRKFLKYAGFSLDQTAGIQFPNGIKGYFNRKEINQWFYDNGKKALIVIPSYNDFEVLSACIVSLKETTPEGRLEVVIVDDYCQPENLEKLLTLEDDHITVIPRKKNGGFAKAVNTGLKVAVERNMDAILVNSDIVAKEGWFEALQFGAYQFHKDVGIVGPKLLYPDGRIQSAGSFRNPHAPEWFDHYYRFKPEDYGPANIPQYCLAVTGACLYIKSEVLQKIGILEEYPFAFEDVDYCLRAWEAGYRSLYFPDSTLYHMESVTRKKNPATSDREKASVVKFWQTWGDWFDGRTVTNKKGQTRIIYVLQTSGLSGGIKIVMEHAKYLQERGFATEIWSLDNNPQWPLKHVPHRSFDNYDQLSTALAKEDAIKVATWWETAQPVWLASFKRGIPVYFIQELETWFYPDNPRAQHAVLSCYRLEFNNLTTSQFNLQELNQLQLPAQAIPCGIDTTLYRPLEGVEREKDLLLGVGRPFFQKNFKFTLAAWQAIGEARPRMWLFGQNKEMQKLDSKITYFVKPDDEEVNEFYNQATVFVQTSYHEGFSLPPLEAMAAGCPVILTDSHGNRDYMQDGKNCLVVEQDNIPELTETIQRLFNQPALQKRLSKNGIATAQKFAWPRIIDQLEAYYSDIAAQTKRQQVQTLIKKYK